MKTKREALHSIEGYLAIIPKIQNIYPPEKTDTGYQWGFKYDSGVFEFFTMKTAAEARAEYKRCADAVEQFYRQRTAPRE